MKKFSALFSNRKFKYGGYAIITVAVAVVLVVLLNLLVSVLDTRYSLKVDMTANKLFSLTSQTKEFVSALEKDIYVYTLNTEGSEDMNVTQILEKFTALSGRIHVSNLDIKNNPASVNYYSNVQGERLGYNSVIISSSPDPNDENQRYRVLDSYDMYSYSSETQSYSIFSAESAITRGISYIINVNLPRVWFLDEHNPSGDDPNAAMMSLLESENYEVDRISLTTNASDLKVGDILVCMSPEVDLSPDEREVLKGFAETGGKIIIGLDPLYPELPNFESILALYGLEINDGVVMETQAGKYTANGPYFVVPSLQTHDVTNEVSLPVIYPIAGQIVVPETVSNYNVTVTPLLTSSDSSFLESENSEEWDYKQDAGMPNGPFNLAVAVEKIDSTNPDNNVRMIVVSSASAFSYIDQFATYGNSDLFMNMVGWMSPKEDEIYIRSKSMQSAVLYIQTKAQLLTLTVLVCIVVPVLVFAAAVVVYLRRRHL